MTRKALGTVLLLTALFVATACKKTKSVTDTATTTATTTTVTTGTAAVPTVSTTRTVSAVSITFSGMVVHVFGDAIGERDRAIVLHDNDHPVYLSVPEQVNKTELEAATGLPAGTASGGYYTLGPLTEKLSARVIGWDTTKKKMASTMHKPLVPDTAFDTQAPHLKRVSENEIDQTKLKTSLFDPVPDRSSWALFVALDGGSLTVSKESCVPSKLDKDVNGEGSHKFAAEVKLTGQVDEDPAIQFLKEGGQWETVTFTTAPVGITLGVTAVYEGALAKSHFKMFQRIATGSTKFDDIVYVPCPESGLDPACTNSQWP